MAQHLVLTLRLHEDGFGTARYHGMSQGAPEWPPAPARVFQALVAGVARGRTLPPSAVPALEWLQALPPPVIAAPQRTLGQAVSIFVPNNDADALVDPRDVSGIRTAKLVQPSLFTADLPLFYAWALGVGSDHATTIVEAASDLYQLGRGIDMAWAVAEVLNDDALDACLSAYRGVIHRPELGVRGTRMLACPTAGSLGSLVQRHQATKLRADGAVKKMRVLFTNPPKPRFASVSYEHASRVAVYELLDRDASKPWPWALGRCVKLVETLRDAAAAKLRAGLGDDAGAVERSLVGRGADGSGAVSVAQRVRVVPLPSIGSVHADRAIRRVLVEVPSGGPLQAADVVWAFSGLTRVDSQTGELSPWVLTQSEGDNMLGHYVGPGRRWRSVTAVALPEGAQRRRIDPTRRQQDAKPASERIAEEGRAVAAVRAALRHAGIVATAVSVRVQREPFEAKGARAEFFAEGTRFAKERLWHVEIELDRNVEGPLVIGDGRFVGLGVMAPAQAPAATSGIHAFGVTDGGAADSPVVLARALRRAVMARVRDTLGLSPDVGLDRFFSGHERSGAKGAAEVVGHLAYHWDAPRQRWLLIAPHRLARRAAHREERQHLQTLERALDGLAHVTAGAAGVLNLRRHPVVDDDPLLAHARSWSSVTPYVVTRHRRCASAHEALMADVISECEHCGLPRPTKVTVLDAHAIPGHGLQGSVRLDFSVAVAGPIALGRSARLGGGLFSAELSAE